ncbi:MAG: DNA polymerase I, partial [Polyangiaceae bacterium]
MPSQLPPAGADDVLYLFDLSGYVFRAYHAITTPLTAPSGETTHATLGTLTMLLRLLKDRQPKYFIVAMDSVGETFRHKLDTRYKANRPPPPPDLKKQMDRCREAVEAYRLPVFQVEGVEADDIIATSVRFARANKLRVVILSSDKDLMQLVGDDVVMWDTMRNKVYGLPEVEEKWGVGPAMLRDLLALNGDSSDNVPGVPKVGEKTAASLLKTYNDIDGIYAHVNEIKQKAVRQSLIDNEADARLSQQLVTLKDDIEMPISMESITPGQPDVEKLSALFEVLNFSKLKAQLPSASAKTTTASASETTSAQAAKPKPEAQDRPIGGRAIFTEEELEAFVQQAQGAEWLGFDTETTSTEPMRAVLLGMSFATGPEEGVYIPIGHRYMGAPKQLSLAAVQRIVGPLLASETPPKIGHHTKYDEIVLERHGMPVRGTAFDTMIASYLLDPNAEHGLKETAKRELGLTMTTYDQVTRKSRGKQLAFEEVPIEEATPYAVADAVVPHRLIGGLRSRLEAEALLDMHNDLELPLSRLLGHVEQNGVMIDTAVLGAIGSTMGTQLVDLEAAAMKAAGKTFNINAPRQLESVLFDDLGLEVIKRTKTGRSTDAEVLEALAEQHELPKIILEYRQIAKLKNTYVDILPTLINPATGRIHTRFNQTVAATGRLSSSDPNLQNIPIRSDIGKAIRGAFIAPKGFKIVSADYSQIELRLLAHLSKDPVLLDAFQNAQDIHTRTAIEMFGVAAEAVTQDMRRA